MSKVKASVFLAIFLEALLLHYHLIQLRDVNFQSSVQQVGSPCVEDFGSQSWLFFYILERPHSLPLSILSAFASLT